MDQKEVFSTGIAKIENYILRNKKHQKALKRNIEIM